jgi:hypothetical protein
MHSRHDARETTKAGSAAFLARFERAVDPDGTLSSEERTRRALAARRAYFSALAGHRHAVRKAGRNPNGISQAPAGRYLYLFAESTRALLAPFVLGEHHRSPKSQSPTMLEGRLARLD